MNYEAFKIDFFMFSVLLPTKPTTVIRRPVPAGAISLGRLYNRFFKDQLARLN